MINIHTLCMVFNVDVYLDYPVFKKSKYEIWSDSACNSRNSSKQNKINNLVCHIFRGVSLTDQFHIYKHNSLCHQMILESLLMNVREVLLNRSQLPQPKSLHIHHHLPTSFTLCNWILSLRNQSSSRGILTFNVYSHPLLMQHIP
jgi:hypothetical protein